MDTKWKIALSVLALWAAVSLYAAFSYDGRFKVIACDVGQGDAFLVSKGSFQILVDGGPDGRVLECLSSYMAFWDRTVEVVANTHPQRDHYGGLIDVSKNYKVGSVLVSGLSASSPDYRVLENQLGGGGVRVVYADEVKSVRYGLITLDLFHPSKSFIEGHSEVLAPTKSTPWERFSSDLDPNEFSLVFTISYMDFKALFTGDIPPYISDMVADSLRGQKISYLKVPHHGSKNGMSEGFLKLVNPDFAVISVGAKNTYGHPSPEIVQMLTGYGITYKRTDKDGAVVVVSDGENWKVLK